MKITQAKKFQLIENVDRGAAMLDETEPNWHRQVDLSWLDLSSSSSCICGQLWAHMASSLDDGFGWAITEHEQIAKLGPEYFGFELPDSFISGDDFNSMGYYSFLTELWVEKIEKRLAQDGLL